MSIRDQLDVALTWQFLNVHFLSFCVININIYSHREPGKNNLSSIFLFYIENCYLWRFLAVSGYVCLMTCHSFIEIPHCPVVSKIDISVLKNTQRYLPTQGLVRWFGVTCFWFSLFPVVRFSYLKFLPELYFVNFHYNSRVLIYQGRNWAETRQLSLHPSRKEEEYLAVRRHPSPSR